MTRPHLLAFLLLGWTLLLLGPAAPLLLGPAPLAAQSLGFGKNKVQYRDFRWQVIAGPHVDLYYYPEEGLLAPWALQEAERTYDRLEVKFAHHVFRRIPLIIYSSHQDFEQTNVTPGFLPEGVGGFTEFLKGRVALPFNGSYADLRRVIRHEMVHVFEMDKLSRAAAHRRSAAGAIPPLWFTEGLAEHWSSTWNAEGDMVLRDLVLTGRLPAVGEFWKWNGTFALYKIGQSFLDYLAEQHGDLRIAFLLEELGRGPSSFEGAFRAVYGRGLEEVGRAWTHELKQRYYPEVATRRSLLLEAQPLVTDGPANFQPVVAQGREGSEARILFVSPRSGYTNIYVRALAGGRGREEVVVKGGRGAALESFHPFRSGIAVSADGRLAFSTKFHERDALVIWDIEREAEVARYQFPALIDITSPSWSPAGDRLVFSGLTDAGTSDLYLLDLPTGGLTPLTQDRYADRDPDWSPDGATIVFASDRTAYGGEGYLNLFLLDLASGEIRYLTCGRWNDASPRWAPDGRRIAFASDRDETYNLCAVTPEGRGCRLTRFDSATLQPEWLPGGQGLCFTAFHEQQFGIYQVAAKGEAPADSFALDLDGAPAQWRVADPPGGEAQGFASRAYARRFSLDIAQGGIGFASAFGTSQGGQFLLTDMLGDQAIYFQIDNSATATKAFLKSFNGSVTYINRKHRLNYGLGGYRFSGAFIDVRRDDLPFSEEQFGGYAFLSYPFSKFLRLETGLVIAWSDRRDFITDFSRRGLLATNTLALIKDTSLWLPTGPIDGERMNLTVALTTDLASAQSENVTLLADLRKYFRTSLATAYAVRLQARLSEGSLPERFFLGGSWSLRGYPRFSLIGTRSVLLNQEWRFSLFDRLLLRTPLGEVALPGAQGALFLDAGNAWDREEGFPGWLGSFGLGVRVSLGGPLVLRFDFSKLTDFHSVAPGTDVDFFFGYNY